ncbi:DUF1707 domain-containing protein [Kribbella sandramycini]|uniref:DUF1707 domain-containing protein n=1 Tax=Kribbella sandramycini TaxID=60450 RepID=A0A7Y4KY81_9ACTN|nr:DUF1707 domain-containing protein [Kribbella sandramycini]MBB6567356.1 hypothetical protein [Kribbella sandramycini]NOL40031.1 DUF1707 domain-containing protein [Kribbella sandramycini]
MNDPIRIGDSEREEAVRRLGEHYEAGRLTAEEHAERVETALQAKTAPELTALFGDLPGADGWVGTGRASGQGAGEAPWVGGAGAGGPDGQPPWGRGPGRWSAAPFAKRGPLGWIPLPLLILLGVLGVVCAVVGGHPPVLLGVALVVGLVLFVRKRRVV